MHFTNSNYSVVSTPDWIQTGTELVPGVVPNDKPVKIRFGDWFGHALGIKPRAELLAKEMGC